jgi:methylmalonyl-CoA mutase N-terminal domain/subunit
LPTETAAGIALRTQQIVAFESGIADTADPLAGSYYVESMTAAVEAAAWDLIKTIDAMGGSVSAIEEGFIQNEIANSAYRYQQDIESGKKIIVGVNRFEAEHEEKIPGFRIDDSIQKMQASHLTALKQKRNQQLVTDCLHQIRLAAENGSNLMPPVLEAVTQYCTLGEIADTLRDVFGEYR